MTIKRTLLLEFRNLLFSLKSFQPLGTSHSIREFHKSLIANSKLVVENEQFGNEFRERKGTKEGRRSLSKKGLTIPVYGNWLVINQKINKFHVFERCVRRQMLGCIQHGGHYGRFSMDNPVWLGERGKFFEKEKPAYPLTSEFKLFAFFRMTFDSKVTICLQIPKFRTRRNGYRKNSILHFFTIQSLNVWARMLF